MAIGHLFAISGAANPLTKACLKSAMKSQFYEAINEPKTIKRRPVLGTLAYLADAANSAIKLFS